MFDILQEILQSHPFLKSRKFKGQGYQRYGVKRVKSIFANKGTVKQGLGQFCTASNSSHFFNKTDFELYLFKQNVGCVSVAYERLFTSDNKICDTEKCEILRK